jgi:signal transduction histidine kinase
MLGSIDLLALKANSPPEHRAVGRIRHAASQLDTHLRDVTEYTRLENPAWRLQRQAVDVVALVREVCEHYQAQARNKGLELDCDVPMMPDPALARVMTDSARVRQILDNLIGNALKYTTAGCVTVRAQLNPEQNGVQLEVQDTGIGIPEQDRARIFEPYVRLEDRRAGSAEGSGLGLAIVRRLVDRLGGALHLRSVLGQGSCFTVVLPLQA